MNFLEDSPFPLGFYGPSSPALITALPFRDWSSFPGSFSSPRWAPPPYLSFFKKKIPLLYVNNFWGILLSPWILWTLLPSPHYGCLPTVIGPLSRFPSLFPGKAPPPYLSLLFVYVYRGAPFILMGFLALLSYPHYGLHCSRDWVWPGFCSFGDGLG